MTYVRLFMIIAVIGLMMISCGLITETPSTEAVVVTDTVAPTQAMVVTNTVAPTQTSKPVMDASPTKSAAEVPPTTKPVTVVPDEIQGIPDKPLSGEGPWWLFSTTEGLFAINPDGSGLTQFYHGPVNSPYARQISAAPSGGYLAYLIGEGFDATLKITEFSGRTLVTEKPIFSDERDPEMEAMRAIVENQSIAFSPDGRFLAFMGAINGPTSDLYLYSLDSFETTQLTDGPSQAYQPVWSPDGKYIVHTGASSFGSGAGYTMDGIWAARTDDSEVMTLYDPSGSGSESIIGWVDNQTFVVHSWDVSCGSNNLRTFNIETKESDVIWSGSFRSVAFDPSNAVAVLSSNDGECSPDGGAGIYLVPTDGNAPRRIVEVTGPQVIWSQEANLFLASGDFGSWVLAIASNGQFIDLDMPQDAQVFPAVATGSRDLAWPGESLWIGPLLGSTDNPPQEIFNEPVYTVTWAPNGQSVIFFADSGLYIAHQPDYTPILIVEGPDNRNGYSGCVLP